MSCITTTLQMQPITGTQLQMQEVRSTLKVDNATSSELRVKKQLATNIKAQRAFDARLIFTAFLQSYLRHMCTDNAESCFAAGYFIESMPWSESDAWRE